METTRIVVDPAHRIDKVDPRIFGGFLEHMGRAVYEGIYDPGSPLADEDGCRTDTLAALRELRMTNMRYPGGNFASGYHWKDGIGPRELRPTVRELAWQSIEPNQFGSDEFLRLAQRMNWAPMLTVNLGTGTPEEARNWVEYCNSPTGTRFADLRAANGHLEPYGVGLWCLGNEMDGPWQLGAMPAQQYAILAQQAAKLMKDTDPSIETIACGSSSIHSRSYMEWDRVVLEYVGKWADYVSLHRYVGNPNDDTADYLAVSNSIDQQIETMEALCRVVQARTGSRKRHMLCFDEWNVWYRKNGPADTNGRGKFAPPLIEEEYNLEDALVVAGFLNCFIRHADSVKIANLAQIVNVIAPIQTRGDQLLRQSIFHTFALYAQRREGFAVRPAILGPAYDSPSYGPTQTLDASAILGGDVLHLFLINRSLEESADAVIDPGGGWIEGLISAEVVTGPDAKSANTFEQPQVVTRQPLGAVRIEGGKAYLTLPRLSAAGISLRMRQEYSS